jgi:DNA polymerase III gamma/tau subunit
MDITHKTTSAKLISGYRLDGYSKFQQEKISEIAAKISLNSLTRIWQMLNKGITEINFSSSPKTAFEMLMVRICHIIALPNLQKILLDLNDTKNSKEENFVAQKQSEINDEKKDLDLVSEVLRSFEGAKII